MTQVRRPRGVNRVGGVIGRFGPNGESGVWPVHSLASDPYYDNVQVLLKNDPNDNGTAFTDASKNAATITVHGDAKSTTTATKWQATSIATGGNSNASANLTNAVGLPANAIAFGAGDFTVEAWYLKTTSFTNHVRILAAQNPGSGGSNRVSFLILSTGRQYADVFGTVLGQSNVLTWNDNQWYHLALTRRGTTLQHWRDGVQVASATTSINFQADSARSNVAPSNTGHYISEVRVTVGIARYQAAFTPPTRPFLP